MPGVKGEKGNKGDVGDPGANVSKLHIHCYQVHTYVFNLEGYSRVPWRSRI